MTCLVLSMVAIFLGEIGFVLGSVISLLGRAGDFSEVGVVIGVRIFLLCVNAISFVQLDFVEGLSLACLVGLVFFLRASNLVVVCDCFM